MKNRREEMAVHAYSTVPIYKKLLEQNNLELEDILLPENWERIPLMEKKNIVLGGSKTISENYLALFAMDKLLKTHTSGSTGTSLDVFWDMADYQNSLLPLWMERWKTARIHPRDRVCFFNTVLENNCQFVFSKNAMIISKSNMDEERLLEIYGQMEKFAPKWALLHPSMALLLCDFVERRKVEPISSLEYIELTGEMILESLKKRVSETFSCTVRCHYGAMEVSTMGYETGNGRYRLLESSTYVEILDDNGQVLPDGEAGNIYITSLHNHAMPIVRYGIGDCGEIYTEKTDAGTVRYLELLRARKNDWVLLPGGKHIMADMLLKPVEVLNTIYETVVYQVQAIQKGDGKIQLNVVLDSEFSEEEFIQGYMNILDEKWAKGFLFEFVFHENLFPAPATGKLGWFQNELLS
ncbi:MAG: phenylacetate--CoA ligase family protein [Lachnospiraceae bacterium]|nr:phenylacetate--CoA ligase family protein [Lachnospiraceae bacterium]